jgi:hypothetical protein
MSESSSNRCRRPRTSRGAPSPIHRIAVRNVSGELRTTSAGMANATSKTPRVDGVIASDVHSTVIRSFRTDRSGIRLRARPQSVATEVASDHEQNRSVTELISAYRHRVQTRHDRSVGNDGAPATPVSISRITTYPLPTSTRSFRPARSSTARRKSAARHRRGARTHVLRQRRR